MKKLIKNGFSSSKAAVIAIMFLLVFSIVSMALPVAEAAGAITLTPPTQVPGSSVTVEGTDFGATKAVGIGFGAELNVTGEEVNATGPYDVDFGPYVENLSYWPVKPGSITREAGVMIGDVYFSAYAYWDDGNGVILTDNPDVASATIDYTTGKISFNFSSPLSGSTDYVRKVNYTHYEYNVTPAAGATTDGSGVFSASITVPSVANGDYTVTAVDTAGNMATATLNTIPEGLTIGVMLLLSTIAVIVSLRYFRKKPKLQNW